MKRHPDKMIALRGISPCLCVPDIGYVCRSCERDDGTAIVEECAMPTDRSAIHGPPWDMNDLPPELQGYGHRRADQDGGDGSEWITPEEDKSGQFFEALKIQLDVVWPKET